MLRLLCLFGYHHRSRGAAHDEGARFVSVCKRCGKPMVRTGYHRWTVAR